tara:strand:- start:79 stop:534 length:456 start_codon:yes stop_codon:yes gene_type:complete
LKQFFFFLFLAFSSTSIGQKVSIQFISTVDIDERIQLPKVAKDSIGVLKISQQLIDQYRENSYLTASIDSIIFRTKDNAIVFLYVGDQFNWSQLGKGNISDEALSKVNFRENIYFNRPLEATKPAYFWKAYLSIMKTMDTPLHKSILLLKK